MKNNETNETQQNNPLHGVTLQQIVEFLVAEYGWIELNRRIEINCFYSHPSIKSSLKFLRKENWARIQVERLYLNTISGSASKNRDFHE